jgi:hypothetical protein
MQNGGGKVLGRLRCGKGVFRDRFWRAVAACPILSRFLRKGGTAPTPTDFGHPEQQISTVILSDVGRVSRGQRVEGPAVVLVFSPSQRSRSNEDPHLSSCCPLCRQKTGICSSTPCSLFPYPCFSVSGREFTRAANRPPIFREIKHAAKPRPAPFPPHTAPCPILSRFFAKGWDSTNPS